MEVIGNRVVVDFCNRTFLRADAARKIAEVIDSKREVSVRRLADRLAVVDRLDKRQDVEIFFHPVGDFREHASAFGRRGIAPRYARLMRRIERQLDIFSRRTGDLANLLTGDRRHVGKVLAAHGRNPLPTDEIVIARLDDLPAFELIHSYMLHTSFPPE